MTRFAWLGVVAILVTAGAYVAVTKQRCATSDPGAAEPGATAGGSSYGLVLDPVVGGVTEGKVKNAFDPVMSATCRFSSCATKLAYKESDIVAQPRAEVGDLTRCPVSGVVFAVDEGRPQVRIGQADYVTCCDVCAQKLRRNPSWFIRV